MWGVEVWECGDRGVGCGAVEVWVWGVWRCGGGVMRHGGVEMCVWGGVGCGLYGGWRYGMRGCGIMGV